MEKETVKIDMEQIRPLIKMAIEEDLGTGDVTSEILFTDNEQAKADIVSREEIVVCGMDIASEILRIYDERLKLKIKINDGESAHVGNKLGTIEGPLRAMLSAERILLNFLQRLSGIATTTQKICLCDTGNKSEDL